MAQSKPYSGPNRPVALDDPDEAEESTAFSFKGTTLSGRQLSGHIAASSEDEARAILTRACVQVEPEDLRIRREPLGRRKKKVKREELGLFANQLADRLSAGEPMPQAIEGEAKATSNRLLKDGLREVADHIHRRGISSAEAFRQRLDVFPEAFCHLIQIGEIKGDPTDLLREFGNSQIRTAETLGRLKGALVYPCAVLGMALAVSAVLIYYVIPKMQEIYMVLLSATGGKLPFMTRALLAIADFLISVPGMITVGLLIGGVVAGFRWAKGPGKETVQRKALDLPVAGPLLRMFNASYTARSIGLLLGATDLSTALRETASASLNVRYREMAEDIRETVTRHGRSISEAAAPYAHLMGDEFQAVVAAGEDSGQLTNQFIRFANVLDERVRRAVEGLSRIVEPAMIIFVGVIIGMIVVAAYLPLFTLIGELSGKR